MNTQLLAFCYKQQNQLQATSPMMQFPYSKDRQAAQKSKDKGRLGSGQTISEALSGLTHPGPCLPCFLQLHASYLQEKKGSMLGLFSLQWETQNYDLQVKKTKISPTSGMRHDAHI